MKRCTVCGMAENDNPAHGSEFKGVGAHAFNGTAEVKSHPMDEIIVSFGGALKSVGDNAFEGYLVRFSSAADPDLVGDYFTKSTEFFVEDGAVIPILYDHGLNATMKKTKIGRATVKYDDEGLFIKGELETAANYKKFVAEIKKKLIDAGKAGLSSGAASHMVERKQIKKGINEIVSWGIAEASVTPAATEPRCEAVSLKSYFDTREDPMAVKAAGSAAGSEDFDPEAATKPHAFKASTTDPNECSVCGEEFGEGVHTKSVKKLPSDEEPEENLAKTISVSVKGLFEAKLAEKTPSVWETRSVLDEVYRDIATAASISDITGVTIDIEAKVKEAKLEEAAREIPLVVKQITDWQENGGSSSDGCGSRYFYLRSVQDIDLSELSVKGGLVNGLTLDEHSDRVVHAVEEYANLGASLATTIKSLEERCIKKIEYRAKDPVKSGRTLSKATVEKLASLKEKVATNKAQNTELETSLNSLLALAEPKKSADAAEVLSMEFQLARTQTDLALSGATLS